MNLADIGAGEWVGVDTNILVYANQQKSAECIEFLRRCAVGDIRGVVPLPMVAELIHALMLIEARENGWVGKSSPARALSARPDLVRRLVRYEIQVREFLSLGLRLEPVLRGDFPAALRIQREFGLLTNDALLLAVLQRLNVGIVASADAAFRETAGLTVCAPSDLKE